MMPHLAVATLVVACACAPRTGVPARHPVADVERLVREVGDVGAR